MYGIAILIGDVPYYMESIHRRCASFSTKNSAHAKTFFSEYEALMYWEIATKGKSNILPLGKVSKDYAYVTMLPN